MQSRPRLAGVVTMCAALFAAPSSGRADLTRKVETPAETPAEVGVAAGFAKAVSEAVGKEVSMTKVVDGMPEALSAMVDQATLYMKQKRPYYVDAFKKALPTFDAAWTAYVERAKVVQAAIVKAEAARKDGKLADAQTLLESVITPVDITPEGLARKVVDKPCLEPRDAELVAVQLLGEVYLAQKDLRGAFQIALARYDRRFVGEPDDERLLWLGCTTNSVLADLGMGQKPEVGHAIDRVSATIAQSRADQVNAAWWFIKKLSEGKDVPAITLGSPADIKKGQWVWFYVKLPTEKSEKVLVSGNATIQLAEALPAWARTDSVFYVAGKVKEKGKAIVITDAFVPELRLFNTTGYGTPLTRSYYWLPVADLAAGMQKAAAQQLEQQEQERIRRAAAVLRALSEGTP